MPYWKLPGCAFLLIFIAALPAAGAVLTWDASTASPDGPQDGSGTWSTGGNNWWNGSTSANQAWANGDSAIIGGSGTIPAALPTVTVSGTVALGELTFADNGQPANGAYEVTGGTLSFNNGSSIKVNQARDSGATTGNRQNSKISAAISGADLTFTSDITTTASVNASGFLDVSGINTNTGTLTLGSNATVFLTNSAAFSAGVTSVTINPTSTLDFNFAGTITVPFTLNSLGASDGSTIGIVPTHAAPITSNAGALRLGTVGVTLDFNSPVTFTGDSEIQAAAGGGNIANLNATGANLTLTSAYHLTLRANQGSTLNVNRAIDAASLGLREHYSSSSGGGTININQPVTASDLFVVPNRSGVLTINAPITLNTAAGSGKMTAVCGYSSLTTFQINATITAPGGIEFQKGLITATSGVELNSASGFALDTPEILFTPAGTTSATLVVTKANDQVSHNAVLTFKDTGNVRTFRLEGHTATVAGIQTTGTFATATQAVIENTLTGTTGTLTVENAADYSFGGRIRDGLGLFALVKKGVGKLSLTGDRVDDYTGGTIVEEGTLDLSNAIISATGYKLTLNAGTIDFGFSSPSMGLITITNGTATGSGSVYSNVNYEVQGGTVAVPLAGAIDPLAFKTGLNKTGPGTATLTALNYYSGKTTIGEGTLKLTGSGKIDYSTVVELQNGATLDVSEISGYTSGTQTIQGNGTIVGSFATGYGATLAPGVLKTAQTLTFANGLALSFDTNLNFDLATTAAGVSDKINVNGNLNVGDLNSFNVNVGVLGSSVQLNTPYTVLTYTGSLSGSAYSFSTAANTTRLTYTTALDTIGKKLTVTATGGAPKTLAWAGTASTPSWDLKTTNNWLDGATPEMFYDLDTVNFGDGQFGTVNLWGNLRPAAINVNATQDYEFTGSAISGDPMFTKLGSGTLILSNANDFTSDMTISGGTVRINNAAALGSSEGKTRLTGTGIIDFAGFSIGNEEVVVESGSNAKLTNSVDNLTVTQDALRYLVLNGDVSVGGQFRWDIRNRVLPAAETYLAGNGHKITKVDSNRVDLVDLGETNLGDVDIQQGHLSFTRSTTMGNPTGTVSVAGGATMLIYGSSLNYDKKVSLADTARLALDHASKATISGLVTLSGGTATIDLTGDAASATTLKLSGDVTGPGGLTITGPATSVLTLDGAKSYTGNTLVSSGILSLIGSGAMDSAVVTVNTTLNVVDGDHTLKVIGGTGTVNVASAASLTAVSINVDTLKIGGTAAEAAAVPEPATWLILLTAAFAGIWHRITFRRKL